MLGEPLLLRIVHLGPEEHHGCSDLKRERFDGEMQTGARLNVSEPRPCSTVEIAGSAALRTSSASIRNDRTYLFPAIRGGNLDYSQAVLGAVSTP